jgi:heavy metal translocating P-type ATPase
MFKRVRNFLREYKQLTFVGVAILIGLALDLTNQDTAAHWVLGISVGIATIPLLWNMIQTIRDGAYGVDILAATAIITSLALQQYWAAAIIVLMLTGGEALEDYAESRAKNELTALLKQKPKKAHLRRGTKTIDVPVKQVETGDKLVVLPGEVIPVDAVILEGTTSVDESKLTGESIPIERTVGDELLSGSVNVEGSITIQALRPEADSQYEQIIKLVRTASASQSPFVRMADRFSIPFTIVSFIIAGVAWIISGEAIRFLEVLVVATPCPLLLGAPIALISGMSRAAKHGVIVKTGSALERLAEVQTFAFDKTGTLTMGKPTVSAVKTYNKYTEAQVLHFAAALETNSRHVLAQAIIEAAAEHKLKVKPAKQVTETSGRGLSGRIEGKTVMVGRSSLLADNAIELPKGFKPSSINQTATFVIIDQKLAGVILFQDKIRTEAEATLKRLRKLGIKQTAMVTGDNEATALKVAKELDITDVYPDCLPVDKLLAVEQLPKRPVAFVGDGVNDAPVLTAADVGIALGARGSTAASESADVVILHDDLERVATATEVSRRTFAIARQSILIGILISLGLMGAFATGKFTAIQGALIQEVVDVIVILNALRAHGSWKQRVVTPSVD